MAQVEIEPVGPEGSHKSGQEVGDISYHIEEGNWDLREKLYPKIASFPTPSTPCKKK